MGKISCCDFPVADLRNSYADIFHCVRARDSYATPLGGGRILVFFPGRHSLADRVLRSSASDLALCLRTRAHPRNLGLAHGGRVSRFRISRDGGHVVTSKANFWIALAPYFFPIYSILAIVAYGVLSFFLNMQPYGRLLYAVIGATWAFHFTFTCWMIPKNQTDLSDQGTFFSLVVIYLMNLLLLSTMLILASSQITFASFGADLLMNLGNFAQWMVQLLRGIHSA